MNYTHIEMAHEWLAKF